MTSTMVLTILSRIDDTYSPHVPLNAGVTETPPRTAVRTCEGTLMHRTKTLYIVAYPWGWATEGLIATQ
jgi:hypothetical protein